MKLPNELKQFDARYDIALAQGVFCRERHGAI